MGTHHRGPAAEVRALDAFVKLMRAADSVSAHLAGALADAGLSEGQFGVLEALYHLGPLCQCDLGAKLLRSGGNITMVVDNLEKHGLVRRQREAADRRYISVQLSEAGRKLIARLFPRHAAAILAEMAVLKPEEQETLGHLCRKLGRQERG